MAGHSGERSTSSARAAAGPVAGRLEPDNYDAEDTRYRSFTLVVDDLVLPDRSRTDNKQDQGS